MRRRGVPCRGIGSVECQSVAELEPAPEPQNECGQFSNARTPATAIVWGTIKACFDACNNSDCYDGCFETACEQECLSGVSEEAIISLNDLQSCLDRRCAEDPDPTTCLAENCPAELEECGPIPDNFF